MNVNIGLFRGFYHVLLMKSRGFLSSLNALKLEKQLKYNIIILCSYNLVNRGKYSRKNGPILRYISYAYFD